MDKRSMSYVALCVSGAVVLLALLILVVEVRSAPPPTASAEAPVRAAEAPPDAPAARPATPTPPLPKPAAPALPRSADDRHPPSAIRGMAGRISPDSMRAARVTEQARSGGGAQPPAPVASPQQLRLINEASDYYGRGDYENARTTALEALTLNLDPMGTDRMQRIIASSACFMGDAEEARVWYERLIPTSKADIAKRCRRMGIEFNP